MYAIRSYYELDTPDMYIDTTSHNEFIPGITGEIYNTVVFPNPFSDNVNVEYSLLENENVIFEVYSISGQMVLSEEMKASASYNFV